MNQPVPLVRVHRGKVVESTHHGSLVLTDRNRVIFAAGTTDATVFYRSTSKPLQALVGITSGAAERFGFDDEELAIAAGSHSGQPAHHVVVRRLLDKAGLAPSALRCGGHFAFHEASAIQQRKQDLSPEPLWSNCSGNHAIMLAAARAMDAPLDTYLEASHPVQVEIRRHIALFAGLAPEDIAVAIDGCSVPAFGLPLDAMAISLARFGRPDGLPADLEGAARRVAAAMLAHPFHVGGDGRFDTDLMRAGKAPLIGKAGAEGVHGTVLPERGLGLAVKVEDGHDRGYRLAVVAVLEHLGVLAPDEADTVRAAQCDPEIRARTGEPVGRLEVALDLSSLRL